MTWNTKTNKGHGCEILSLKLSNKYHQLSIEERNKLVKLVNILHKQFPQQSKFEITKIALEKW
jgi:hypothetical protein